jgi:maltose-binding protein MalE
LAAWQELHNVDLLVGKIASMRVIVSIVFALAATLATSLAHAQSADVESSITAIDGNKLTISLSDGKTYSVPEEFNFEGLEAGVKVNVFYTVVDGKRVVDDLIVLD